MQRRMETRKEKRETFNSQRPLRKKNRNQPKNTEEKKRMWLAFLVIRYLNFIIVLFFGKKRIKTFLGKSHLRRLRA